MTRSLEPLPIDGVLAEVVGALADRPCLVLRADTGAGKTTRVPPALLATPWCSGGRVIVLEPRRVAARAAARRIAAERGWTVGEEVGYQVRFDRCFSDRTRLLVVTEGLLVQMLQRDPFLDGVAAVIFDEFHERNLHSDLALAMCRKVQREARPELRLVVMSATLDPWPLRSFLGEDKTRVVDSPGRLFPVAVEYLARRNERPVHSVVRDGVERMLEAVAGDLLVFLPGVGEIRRSEETLAPLARRFGLDLVPLYGDLPPERQDLALAAGPRRRVVLATNVAETSVTVEGVEAVVDSGLARVLRFDPSFGLDRLELGRISRASAEQRKGRAGRLAPGRCLRLWTEHDDLSRPERDLPEIQRVDLAASVLELLAWGESDPRAFPWLDAPDGAALDRALELLEDLGATRRGVLTDLGRTLVRMPVHPRLARLLVAGWDHGVLGRTARLASLLSERDLVLRPRGRRPAVASRATHSDTLDRLEALEEWQRRGYGETALGPVDPARCRHLLRVANQLEQVASNVLRGRSVVGEGAETADNAKDLERADAGVLRALLAAYPDRVARRRASRSALAVMVGGRGVELAETSSVYEAELFLAIELAAARPGVHASSLVRQASAVERDWLVGEVRSQDVAVWDDVAERVRGLRRTLYRDLVLQELEIDAGAERATQRLVEAAAKCPERALDLAEPAVAGFLARVRSLRIWRPELELPAFDAADFAWHVLPHLAVGRRSFAELRRAPLLELIQGVLTWEQLRALDREAPERVQVPSGNQVRLDYGAGEPGSPPVLAARIQELFGLATSPTVAGGGVQVLMHLLAPNMRPQQVTQDLASFWSNTYPEVRKELAGRYPKHDWPQDPTTAVARRRPDRR